MPATPASAPPPSTPSSTLSSQPQSTPLSASAPSPRPQLPEYREVSSLPFELREPIVVYLEEGLYTQALTLLHNLLSARVLRPPVPVPPPTHLAVLFTLIVHPSVTRRARTPEHRATPALALRYLRALADTVGPRAARIPEAAAFPSAYAPGGRQRRGHRPTDADEGMAPGNRVTGNIAQEGSLFTKAGDFWAAVGWALNCSVTCEERWVGAWQGWLGLMLRLLEDDWHARESEDEKKGSLLVQYVGESSQVRRIIRAVFADGTAQSAAEFGEVWKGEAKPRKVRSRQEEMERALARRKARAPGDDDNDADYLVSDDETSSDSASQSEPRKRKQPSPPAAAAVPGDPTTELGGPAALSLRLRLMGLLSRLAADAPGLFVPSSTLFDLFLAYIRPLPVPTFAAVLSPPTLAPFPPAHAVALLQNVAQALLEPGAHSAVSQAAFRDLDQDVLERAYLPWAAGTAGVADNAKASACIESLIRIFDRAIGLEGSAALKRVADGGIKKRENKGTRETKRKGEAGTGSVGEADRAWMRASGERIRAVVQAALPGER